MAPSKLERQGSSWQAFQLALLHPLQAYVDNIALLWPQPGTAQPKMTLTGATTRALREKDKKVKEKNPQIDEIPLLLQEILMMHSYSNKLVCLIVDPSGTAV